MSGECNRLLRFFEKMKAGERMVRYKATIAYDGTNFQGFQRQPNGRTVQEEIEKH